MMTFRKFAVLLAGGMIILLGPELVAQLPVPAVGNLDSSANARVGRPLTPVSVAGSARRTTRRCAAGVYNC
ncbi:MAG: hypothetical protein ACXW36_08855 [Nitrospira sp.]